MRYEYVAAHQVIGVTLPKSTTIVDLNDENGTSDPSYFLTSEPDVHLEHVDRTHVIAGVMLRSVFGKRGDGEAADLIDAEMKELSIQRKKRTGSSPTLIVRFAGDADVNLSAKLHHEDSYAIGFDLFDKSLIRNKHRSTLQDICAAVCLIPDKEVSLKHIAAGVYAVDEAGKAYYSLNVSGSASATVAYQFSTADTAFLRSTVPLLTGNKTLETVTRLMAQALDADADSMKAFLAGWTGLEILVNKIFRVYESVFMDKIRGTAPPTTIVRYFDRIRSVMKDKYTLVDKFTVIVGCVNSEEADDDIKLFTRLKNTRDELLHGADISEDELPIQELRKLLVKYVRRHLQYSAA